MPTKKLSSMVDGKAVDADDKLNQYITTYQFLVSLLSSKVK